MKKLLRFLLWLAGTAVFLLATAHFTLRHLLNTPKFKAAATGFVERTTGRTADYGRIDYRLFPFSLVVRDAVLREKGGAQEFASIQAFSATVDFRTKEISALRLERPSIRIVQREDGSFNFSDLVSAPPAGESAPAPSASLPPEAAPPLPAVPPAPAQPAEPPLAIRLVQIEDAQFEFIRPAAAGGEESFQLSNLDFQLRDVAPDKPFRMEGSVAIGGSSTFQFELSGPPLAQYSRNPEAWPMAFRSKLDIRDFKDLQMFLPPGTRPFQRLETALEIQGALADKTTLRLDFKTSAATEDYPVELNAGLRLDISLPAPVAQHLLAGAPLPPEFQTAPAPCVPPPGAISLAENPRLVLLLRHAQATAELAFPKIAYGQNRFEQGTAAAFLRDGVLAIPAAKLSAYGGTIEARGNAQLLACPLSYRLDRLVADQLAIEQALAANGFGDLAGLSGRLHLEASASGTAVAEPGLRALVADATGRIDGLQSVGTGGSLMDQAWLQLDHPVLLQLVPRLKAKVEQAKQAAAATTTSRYDTATATLALRNGKAALSGTRLSMPGYRLDLFGAIFPFDDRLDLSAHLVASPEETAALTGGKDLSAYLPYEEGGLLVPLFIRGSLRDPQVQPDLDRLLENAWAGIAGGGPDSPLDSLSKSDRKHVEKGLEILGGLLQP